MFCYNAKYYSSYKMQVNRRDRIVVGFGFTTTCAIGAYHPLKLLMERCTRYNIYVIKFATDPTGHWFFLGASVSSTNKTDRYDISEILLKWR